MSTTYNERSWAADLISFLNGHLGSHSLNVRSAGGEYTIGDDAGTLFPDVLLFGDRAGQSVVQGWELKMPDTPLTDSALLENAERKARTLRLDSFVVWNVDEAALYLADPDDSSARYTRERTWSLPNEPARERAEVQRRRDDWEALARDLVGEVDRFLEDGTIRDRAVVEALSAHEAVEAIFGGTAVTQEQFEHAAARDSTFDAETQEWWDQVKKEYPKPRERMNVLARRSLTSWTGKVMFAHVLKSAYREARAVEELSDDATAREGLRRLERVAEACNFLSIFQRQLGDEHVPQAAWVRFTQLSDFLSDVDVERIGEDALEGMLRSTVTTASRKSAGQFTTPPVLAQLLVRVAFCNKYGTFYDPFCGTGTIARAAYDVKEEYGQPPDEALRTVWASDKFSFPVQMATLALARPTHRGEVLRVFKRDVADVQPSMGVDFRDPDTGQSVTHALPLMNCIAANLPFVQFEDVQDRNPTIAEVDERIRSHVDLDVPRLSKRDLYAYLPFYLWDLLADDGRAGLVLSNSWLANNWGPSFAELLAHFYNIEKVVVSGTGRWFENADVVASLLFLRKRSEPGPPSADATTAFVTLQEPLEAVEDDLRSASAALVREDGTSDWVSVHTRSRSERQRFEALGMTWNSFFADVDWLHEAAEHLVPARSLFEIKRGKRTGWDAMFFPPEGTHGIEEVYLRKALKSSSDVTDLVATPATDAFCCSASLEELRARDHTGALSWIKQFEQASHPSYGTIAKKLRAEKPSRLKWYEMPASTMADLAISMNPGDRLFAIRMHERSFVNQRLIRFTLKSDDGNLDLYHALFNSVVGLFYTEALGFGRGLGALDLNATKLRERMFMLDPNALGEEEAMQILQAFESLLQRPVEALPSELARDDRQAFDRAVLGAFGLSDLNNQIRSSLQTLYGIRTAAND